ncbi:hypothetical protein GCM10027088_10300 [Nocardia goodfellowii]|uniref:Uncharacterized protein n=1 Tax=Nocardia goodfellowii TaxID=882446 RepID=A0ABS4QEP6_9NOCA|nr:hypothetical protein [Nocardia goodfellowii]
MRAEASASPAESELLVRISAAAEAARTGQYQATYPAGMPSWSKLWATQICVTSGIVQL